jgi:hypothetical protein
VIAEAEIKYTQLISQFEGILQNKLNTYIGKRKKKKTKGGI